MKKRLLTYALLLLAGIGIAYGQNNFDFSAVSSSGHTLFYHINPDNTTVTVVSPSDWGWAGSWEWEDYLPWGSLTIPSNVSYGSLTYSVTAIGSNAFADCYDLTSVTIPNTITSIGAFAFYHCNILSLAIPNSVISIGNNAFEYVFNIEYHGTATGSPWGATHLNAFFDDGFVFTDSTMTELISYTGEISDIEIPNTVTAIGNEAFSNPYVTSITSVTIPNSVNQIGDYAFYGCSHLFSVIIQNAATSIGEYAFASCHDLVSLNLGDSVTTIGDNAFEYCSALTSVAIPNSVSSIGSFAYHNCYNMTSLTIGGSVDTIGDYAFSQCRTLAPVVIPPTITTIGEDAFSNVPLILYCGSATGYPWGAQRCICGYVDGDFAYTDSTRTTLKAYLGDSTIVIIPNTVTAIGDSAFYNHRNIISVVFPDSVTHIGDYAFYFCRSLLSVTLPNTVTSIGEYAFGYCMSLTSIIIPDSVVNIGRGAFSQCYNIPSITVPSSTFSIGDWAFSSVKLIIYLGQATGSPWGASRALRYAEGDFLYTDSTKTLLGLYTGDSAEIAIPHSVTVIGERAFADDSTLVSVTITNSVTTIEREAFYNCPNLRKVVIGSSVSEIQWEAFAECGQIDTISFLGQEPPYIYSAFNNASDSITAMVPCHSWLHYFQSLQSVFYQIIEPDGCVEYDFWAVSPSNDTLYYRITDSISVSVVHPRSDLQWLGFSWPVGSLIIPEKVIHDSIEYNVTTIAERLFLSDTAITSLSLPHSIKTIGNGAFALCSHIDTLIFDIDSCIGLNPYYEGAFNSRVFYGDTNISTIFLGNHVKTIPDYSFAYYTNKLSSLYLGDSLKHIGNQAFYGCRLLDTLIIPNSVTFIGDMAFMGPEESLQNGRCSHLTTLAIGPSVDTIGNMAFTLHSNLNAITVNPGNTSFDSRNGCNAIIETATNTLVTGCQSTIIPNNTSAIGYGAFVANPNLHSISIPDSVTSIGNFSFYLCDSLSSITFGSSLSSIGAQAFYGCSRLESLSFPASVSSIGEYAFNGCNAIDSITLSCSTPPTIGYGTFGWEIYDIPVTVPCNAISAYMNSLWGSTFSNIIEPTACPAITYYDFWDISPSNDTLYYKIIDTSNVACVHPLMYNYNAEQSYWMGYTQPMGRLELPASVIHDGATYRVSSVWDNTFKNNTDITSVTIPPSIDSLGDFAFAYCNNLDTLYYNPDSCTYWYGQESQWFYEDEYNYYYYNYYDYSTVFQGDSISSLHIGQNVKWLPRQLFNAPGFNSLETLYFNADSIQTDDNYDHGIFEGLPISTLYINTNPSNIPDRAFRFCQNLTSVTIPESVKHIGHRAFQGCSSLSSITIPDSVETIGEYSFNGCTSITSAVIGKSVSSIDYGAFTDCSNLDTVYFNAQNCLHASVYDRYDYQVCFSNSGISTIIIGEDVRTIPAFVFKGCNNLTSITIPDSVTNIGAYAFSECSSLSQVNIGSSVTTIGSGAFDGCTNMDTIVLNCTTPPSFDSHGDYPTFYRVPTDIPVYVPCNTVSAYSATEWNRFSNIIDVQSCYDRPDLLVSNITVPDSIISCTNINIIATIINIGQDHTYSNSWNDVLYISLYPTFNSSAVEIDRVQHDASDSNRLYPDSSYTVNFSAPIPRLWSGETYFYVTTNYENTENEDSTSNNTSQSPMVYVQLPSIVHADSSIFDTACVRYQWHGISYSNSGTYFYTHEYDDSPCINYDTLYLTIWPEYYHHLYDTIMDTDFYSFNGQQYYQTGVYTEQLQSIHGCDSIITLHLQVLPIRRPVVHASVCQGLPYNGNRPRFVIPASITSDTLGLMMLRDTIRTLSGLDSIIYGVDLTVLPSILSSASGLVPAQDSAITHGSLLLRWDSVVGATGYRIFLWKIGDNMPTNPTFTTTNTYQNVSTYENRQTYNWKVEANNPCDTSTSTIQHFLIYKPSYLTTSSHIMNFGEIEFNKTIQKILSITGRDLTDSIRLTLRGSDSSLFTLSTNRINRFGGSVSISFTPTIIRQNYNAYIIINSGYIYDTVFLSSTLANYYVFNVSVADSILPPNTPVVINGTLENAAHQAQTNIPVDIYITIMGQTIVVTDTTDSTGHFNAIYSPKLSECGYYTVGACLHGDNRRPTLASFNIPGVSLVNPHPVWDVTQYDTLFGAIALRNRCNVPLHNISLSVDSMPTGISLQFDSLTLGAFQTSSLHFTLVGNIRSMGDQYEDIKLSVHCTEGQLTRLNAYYYCYKPIPDLQISFDSIVCAVVPGVQKVVDMALINNTDSLFNNIQVRTPTGQSYIQLFSMDSSINIAPHDTVFIPLHILFPQNTPLSTVSDEIWVTADNTQSQQVPFSIKIVPDATGSLGVLVSNEYTYYNNGPHVSGAEISVVGYYSLDTIAFGITDSSGWILFDSVPEGYYKIFVSAPENSPFSKVIQIRAGEQTFVDVDLDFEAITYEWVVYQEDIDGNYEVSLHTEYKTNVPKPVVTIETSPIDIPPDGSFGTFNMVVSNHGLIDAYDATIEMPTSSIYEYIALYDRIDTIPALSSVIIPCNVRNIAIYDTIEKIRRRGNYYIDTVYNVTQRREVQVLYMDTFIFIPTTQNGIDSNGVTLWEYDTTIISIPYYTIDTIYDSTVTNIIYYDALLSEVLLDIDMNPRFNNQKQHESSKSLSRDPSFKSNNENCPIEISMVKVRAKFRCSDNGEKEIISEEKLGTVHGCIGTKKKTKKDISIALGKNKHRFPKDVPTWSWWPLNIHGKLNENGSIWTDEPWYSSYPEWECQPCWYQNARAAWVCNNSSRGRCYWENRRADNGCNDWYEDSFENPNTFSSSLINHESKFYNKNLPHINNNKQSSLDVDVFARNIRIVKQYYDYLLADWKRIVNDTLPIFDSNPEILEQIVGYLQTTNIATVEELATCYDNTVTTIDTSTLRRYAERWNRTLIYSRYGWTDPSMVPTGFSLDYYYPDTNITAAIAAKIDTAIALGYESIEDLYDKTIEAMISSPAKHSQCASVSLQFNQDFAMTREAFTGILSIKNPHSTQPLNNLKTLFFVTDTLGHDCSDKFDISITKWDGIDTTTKSIAADSRGNITVQFVPLMSAAPTDTVPYLFGGSIEYINPYTNDTTSDDLEPVRLPVSPSPHLQLDYFIPHDIIADDPLTSPIIEYTVPATIGLRMKNDGYGTAKNVRIATIQPQITENQLGLVVEFRMLETMRNGAGHSQPLSDINLGNVLPSETQTLEYYLMSSLLGTLTVQDVNVIHKSSVDDKDMSLVDARAHRLVKPVLQYGTLCDSIHDFLTDDIPNGYNIPDSLYLSNGSATAVYEATNTIFDHYVTPSDTIVQVTLYPDTIGWNYGETDDPGRGKYEILSCVRDDSTNIPLDNIWLTFVDLLEDQDPIYINKLHIVDTLSTARTTTYNVTFGLKNNLLDVDTIVLLPLSDANASLDSFMVLFNKPVIDSTFTYSDMSLRFNNGEELMDSTISVRQISDSTFCVDVSQKTLAAGLYVLKVFADSIVDANGHYGYGGKEIHWVRTICTPYNEIDTVTTCDSYTWHNRLLTESGIYKDTIQSFGGCDSIFTLSLTINNSSTNTETVSACDNYTWHGTTYTVSTNAPTYSSYNATGCDSIVTLHLTIYNSTTTTEAVTACDNYTWHDSIYTSSTTMPTYTTTNAVGCDSVTTLHLTVNFSTSDTETVTACDNYTWHDSIYTTSTTMPTYTTTNAVGCDSVTTLHLTVNFSTTDTEYVTACDSYTWHDSTYTTSTTMPTYTTANTVGCDSVTTLYLTVNFSTTDTESITACDSYTWHDSTYTTSTTTPVYITNNNVGCDSIVTLNLTIYYSSTGVDNQTACDSYIWIDGITYTISTSEPTVTTTNIYGCDSTVTLHLTINYSTHDTIIDTATNSYEWNGEVLTESGVYVYEGQTGAGCDSIVTLRLTINHVGFADDAESESLNIYPNPTTGKLIIEAEGVAKVEVFDYSGRIVATFLNTNEVDISHLPTGAYSLRITLHNGTAVKRIIKK